MTHEVTIKLAPILTADRFRNPEWDRPDRILYRRDALQLLPNRSEVPFIVDHDMTHQIGVVDSFFELDWTDGLWIVARGTAVDPPAWIERYHTKASFGYFDVHIAENRVSLAWVKEVSVLSREHEPREPDACVLSIRRADTRPSPGVVASTSAVAGEVIYDKPGQVLRRYFETEIRVR